MLAPGSCQCMISRQLSMHACMLWKPVTTACLCRTLFHNNITTLPAAGLFRNLTSLQKLWVYDCIYIHVCIYMSMNIFSYKFVFSCKKQVFSIFFSLYVCVYWHMQQKLQLTSYSTCILLPICTSTCPGVLVKIRLLHCQLAASRASHHFKSCECSCCKW